jgi:hypothetical protein
MNLTAFVLSAVATYVHVVYVAMFWLEGSEYLDIMVWKNFSLQVFTYFIFPNFQLFLILYVLFHMCFYKVVFMRFLEMLL